MEGKPSKCNSGPRGRVGLADLGEAPFVSGCILFDGPVMLEYLTLLGGTELLEVWITYFVSLYFVIGLQRRTFDQIFSVDISQYSFDSNQ